MPRRAPEPMLAPGPFRVEHLPSKSAYELEDGHPILCLPTKVRGGKAQLNGGVLLRTDPAVEVAGVEIGVALGERTLRAPDVSVFPAGIGDDWARTAPPLALEYADNAQDEAGLQAKIAELLAAGTIEVWVVRLGRTRHVEVYRADAPRRVAHAHEELSLPGVLQNPVPVAAFFDPDQADRVALRNLLDRFGYMHPELARSEGRTEGLAEGRTEGLAEGRTEGLAEGRTEGLAEGRTEGLRVAARAALQARGEPLPDDLHTRDDEALLRLVTGR